MLSAGSGVSLKGSPTVSPIPQVYNCSVAFSFNDSQSLVEVSQAFLALDDRIATMQSWAFWTGVTGKELTRVACEVRKHNYDVTESTT